MLDLYSEEIRHLPAISEKELSDQEVLHQTAYLKEKLKDQVIVLGHHYQNDDIIQFADITGDSLALAQKVAHVHHPFIIFCGVHFMAETADILVAKEQTVLLPDLKAGCSMADMATIREVKKAWTLFKEWTSEKITPITYVNCSADLKAFVGENEGSICTSSNAKKIIEWAFKQGEKLLFFPDQHLGRNTCYQMGIPLDQMVVYNPNFQNGGLSAEDIQKAKVILWSGYCSVHQGFTLQQIEHLRVTSPKMQIIVHPECSFEVVQAADLAGSTAYIIKTIEMAPADSEFAVGTEINLVNRLAKANPDKKIISLSPYQCLCTTMYRVRPRWLLETFRSIERDSPVNIISVPENIRMKSLLALERMLEISKDG